jgi:hypothetical protein
MLKIIAITTTALTLTITPLAAQAPVERRIERYGEVPSRAQCERNSTDPNCTLVQSPRTGSGPDTSTVSPGAGKGGDAAGGGKGGGVNTQGNPASSGGSPQSSQ